MSFAVRRSSQNSRRENDIDGLRLLSPRSTSPPGDNTLTGAWSICWNALPPTLVVTCKTSDFQTKNPTRAEYEHLGQPRKAKLLELNRETLIYRFDATTSDTRFERPMEE